MNMTRYSRPHPATQVRCQEHTMTPREIILANIEHRAPPRIGLTFGVQPEWDRWAYEAFLAKGRRTSGEARP